MPMKAGNLFAFVFALAAGCGGPELLRKPSEPAVTAPIAQATDAIVDARLEAVIVRNGPGSWALDSYWDEYWISIANRGAAPLEVRDVTLVDGFGYRVAPQANRRDLLDGTAKGERMRGERPPYNPFLWGDPRYSSPGVIIGGSAAGVAAGSAMYAPAVAAIPGAGAVVAAAAAVALVPFVVAGTTVYLHEAGVDEEMARRRTPLPVTVEAGQQRRLDLFFPVTVLPADVRITYSGAASEGVVTLDVRRVEPDFPRGAQEAGIVGGRVVAHVDLNDNGSVKGVRIVESQPPGVFDLEAARALYRWQFTPVRTSSRDVRRTEEVKLEFRR
jgi:TonB family protein